MPVMVLFVLNQSSRVKKRLEPKMQIRTKLFASSLMTLALTFTAVNSSYAAEKSPEFKAALAQMKIQKDDFKEIAWYTDKSSPNNIDTNALYMYVGTKKGEKPVLFLRIQYSGDDWLFIKKYLFKIDGAVSDITPYSGEIESDNNTKVWEYYNQAMKGSQVMLMKRIIASKKTVMRMEGSQYYKDVTISSTQKKAMQRVLTLYAGLGGK